MPRTPRSQWGALFNFAGSGIVHMEHFLEEIISMPGQTLLEWIAAQLLQRGTHTARPAAAAVPEGTEYYESDTKLRFKAASGAWVDDGNGNGGGGSSPLLVATTTMTNAQILTLPTTSIEILTGTAGKVTIPLLVFVEVDTAAAAYSNVGATPGFDDWVIQIKGTTQAVFVSGWVIPYNTLVNTTGGAFVFTPPQGVDISDETTLATELTNIPGEYDGNTIRLVAFNAAGDYTGGDAANSAKVTIFYVQADTI